MGFPLLSVRMIRVDPALGKIRALAFAPEEVLWAGAESGGVEVVRATDGEVVRRFHAHKGGVNSLALAQGRVVTGGNDGLVRLWDAERLSCLWHAEAPGRRVRSVALSVGEGLICAVTWSGHARFWDLEGRPRSEAVHVDHGSEKDFHRECMLPTREGGRIRGIGDLLERRAMDGAVLWAATLPSCIEVLALAAFADVLAVAGRARDRKGLLTIANATTGALLPTVQLPYNACSLAFSVDGRELYAGGLGRLFQIPLEAPAEPESYPR